MGLTCLPAANRVFAPLLRGLHDRFDGRSVPQFPTNIRLHAVSPALRSSAFKQERFDRGIEAMKCKLAGLSFGVVAMLMTSMPAVAGGWDQTAGGLKDYGSAAVAVPAPMPIPVFESNYYFRADFGWGTQDEPETSFTGEPYGVDNPAGRFGFLSSFENNNFDAYTSWGIGAGYRFGNGWRMDVTGETRSKAEVRNDGTYSYTVQNTGYYTAGDTVSGVVDDEVTIRGGVFMLNVYYDFDKYFSRRLTPYIGGGLGFAWNDLDRQHSTTEYVCNGCGGSPGVSRTETVNVKEQKVSLAASATVGASYQLRDSISLDVNYRFLYIDGFDGASVDIFNTPSTLHIDSVYAHQVRAGLRFDIQ